MFDEETLKWLASLGVGGILAGFIFMVYRKDSREWQAAWKGQTELLMSIVRDNTKAMTSLDERLERDRTEDRERHREPGRHTR
jgi:hypothetical protein